MPTVSAGTNLARAAEFFGANNGHEWNNLDFYSNVYEGNVMIQDNNGNDKARLAEFLGLLRDSQ
jgi:hypothetical protein